MAEITATDGFAQRLKQHLTDDLHKSGLEVEVEVEPVPSTDLHRVTIISSQMQKLGPMERQDLVWRIIGHHFGRDEQLRISMVLTLSPEELGEEEEQQ
jgi:acid stress-induced BolA-like protein IbaG/YrbA